MTLHTIEVRYEDTDGRHVDVHEAAREGHHSDGSFRVEDGVCACCDATEKTTTYSEENVVKVEYTDSEHDREEREPVVPAWFLPLMFFLTIVVVVTIFVWVESGGTVSL